MANTVNLSNILNTVNVIPGSSNIIEIQNLENTVNVYPVADPTIIEILTPGPKGGRGEPGDPSLFTSSWVSTASYNELVTDVNNLANSFVTTSILFDNRTLALSSSIGLLSSSYMNFTGSYNTGSFTGSFSGNGTGITGIISSSFALNAEQAANSQLLDGMDSAAFTLTSSFNALTASYALDSSSFSSSVSQLQDFSSSLDETFATDADLNALSSSFTSFIGSYIADSSSFSSSINTLSSSYLDYSASSDVRIMDNSSSLGILSSSFLDFSSSYNTGSFTGSFTGNGTGVEGVISSSYAVTSSYSLNVPITASYAISASQAISSSYATTSSYATDFLVAGTITAQTLNVQTITSSLDYITGSTRFGSSQQNTHAFTGSVSITGSLALNGDDFVILTSQTSSMSVLSASQAQDAISSSQAQNAVSSSYTENADMLDGYDSTYFTPISSFQQFTGSTADLIATKLDTGSFQQYTGSNDALVATKLDTGSFQQYTGSANGRLVSLEGKTGSYATTGSNTFQGDQVITGSIFLNSGSLVGTASQAVSSSYALTASYSENVPVTSSYAVSSSQAITSSYAVTASYALNAGSGGAGVTALHTQTTASLEWTFIHNLGERYPAIAVFDSSSYVVVPSNILAVDANTLIIYFSSEQAGTVTATVGGGIPAISASYAGRVLTATSSSTEWKGGMLSSSIQVSYPDVSNIPSGIISGSEQLPSGIISSSEQLPSGIISSSEQLPSGTVSGSSQVLQGTTIHSGSFFNDITVVSGSAQVSFNSIVDKPTLISGSSQIDITQSTGFTAFSGSVSSDTIYRLYQPDKSNPFVFTDNGGSLHINGNIIQSGSTYETHAEQVYSTKDYIILRSGSVGGLATGEYTGIEALLYDGTNSGRLVFDNNGWARVGDSGSEQVLTTRIATPVDTQIAIWDAGNSQLTFISQSVFQTALTNPVTGTGTSGYLPKFTGASTLGDSPIYTDGTNVGIGTTTLNAGVVVVSVAGFKMLSGGSGSLARFFLGRTASECQWGVAAVADQFVNGSLAGDVVLRTELTSQKLILNSGAGNATLVVSGSNVGIGTTTPQNKLEVLGAINTDILNIRASFEQAGEYAGIRLGGSYNTSYGAYIRAVKVGMYGDYWNDDLTFSVTRVGTTTTIDEVMRLTSGGNVGIGKTDPNYALELGSDSAGKPGAGGLWTVVSDARIKTEVELADLDICYNTIKNIPLKRYAWAEGVYTDKQVKDRHNLGWIAQDVQKYFSKAVNVIPFEKANGEVIEDCLDLNSGQLYAAMYGALQKAIEKIESLENEVALLKQDN